MLKKDRIQQTQWSENAQINSYAVFFPFLFLNKFIPPPLLLPTIYRNTGYFQLVNFLV
uniref:Uncharacterized protein n=1 Tax=Anguilla anguilla TaxID=7936 RepID=A0A0E9WBD5_ANGAN